MTLERQLGVAFGPLEIKVLEALWQRNRPSSVRDLMPDFPGTVYTTLMTTMDRLFQKGVLSRQKVSRAFVYTINLSQPEQVSRVAQQCFEALLPLNDRAAARPVLDTFVTAVTAHDEAMLEELEQLVATRRAALKARNDGHG